MEARHRFLNDQARTLRRIGGRKIEGSLTEEQITDFKEAFSFFDRDRDGLIRREDIDLVLKDEVGDRISEAELRKLQEDPSFAHSENGVGFAEFLSMMMRRQHGPEDEDNEMLETFELLCAADPSQRELPISRKFLPTEDVEVLLSGMGEEISHSELHDLLSLADPRGIGRVYLENFGALFRRQNVPVDSQGEADRNLRRSSSGLGAFPSNRTISY